MKSENNVPENFSEIKLADQLRIFLDNPEHEEYHHFTNIDVLKEILISQRWKLSPAKNMNDQHEAIEKNSSGLRAKIYSTCFSHGYYNDMAMWAMYGLPWDRAVQITIKKNAMSKWLDRLQCYKREHSSIIDNISFHDIAYCHKCETSSMRHLYWQYWH